MAVTQMLSFQGGGAVPFGHTLAPTEALQVESASATFDGSGAGGAFVPCLAVYAQSGELIGRYFPGDTIAAGQSAEVSFAPF